MFCFANKKILNRPSKYSTLIEQMLELHSPITAKMMLLAKLANPRSCLKRLRSKINQNGKFP